MSSLRHWNARQMLPSLLTGTLPVVCCLQFWQPRVSRSVRKNPSPQAPEVTFPTPCASQVRGTAIASTLQIQLAQKKPSPLDSSFLLPKQAEGNAVNKWKGSVLPLFPDSQHQTRVQGSVIKENVPNEKPSRSEAGGLPSTWTAVLSPPLAKTNSICKAKVHVLMI